MLSPCRIASLVKDAVSCVSHDDSLPCVRRKVRGVFLRVWTASYSADCVLRITPLLFCSYVRGSPESKIIFPEDYGAARTNFSMCSVTRYVDGPCGTPQFPLVRSTVHAALRAVGAGAVRCRTSHTHSPG